LATALLESQDILEHLMWLAGGQKHPSLRRLRQRVTQTEEVSAVYLEMSALVSIAPPPPPLFYLAATNLSPGVAVPQSAL
jgi:hypothetical protein